MNKTRYDFVIDNQKSHSHVVGDGDLTVGLEFIAILHEGWKQSVELRGTYSDPEGIGKAGSRSGILVAGTPFRLKPI